MISQTAAQPTDTTIASGSVPSQRCNGGLWAGLEVTIRSCVIPFFQSLHPDYLPPGLQPSAQPDEGPGFAIGSADGQDSSLLQGAELGARLVSPYTVLPAEISTLLEGFVTLSAAGRFAKDQIGTLGATTGSASEQNRADSPVDGSPTNDKGRKKKTSQQIRQRTSPPATTSVQPGQLPNTSLALGALASLAAVGTSSASAPDTAPWVEVADAETLGKVCHDAKYPCSKEYRLIKNIDGSQLTQPIGTKTNPFTGQLYGNDRTIGNLSDCLVKKLDGKGRIDRLRFIDANITSTAPAGVAACEISGDAMISNIQVERAYILTECERADAAIAVGKAYGGGTVTNTTAVNCTVATSKEGASAGIAAGLNFKGKVIDTTAVNCTVATSGKDADAGIGAGYEVYGTVTDTTAVNCTVATFGESASAGIGVGNQVSGTITDTTAVNCNVSTSTNHSAAGIGAGNDHDGTITNTIAVNCRVETSGEKFAPAGIGSGRIYKSEYTETIIANTVVVNSTLESKGKGIGTSANIMGGDKPVICNVHINGEQLPDSSRECRYWLDKDFCAAIDHRRVTPDCLAVDTSNGANSPMALPTGAAPLAATLSSGAIAGIALGAAACVLVGGVCVYRYYHRRSSLAASGDSQEFLTINTGDQEAGDQPMIEAVRKEAN